MIDNNNNNNNQCSVFISYAHEDKDWKNQILKYLKPYENEGVSVWHDDKLRAGDEWGPEIKQAICHAKIAILLISIDFFNSSFIIEKEVPLILEQYEQHQLIVFPILVYDCPWKKHSWLSKLQVRPTHAKPLSKFDKEKELPTTLTDISEEVKALYEKTIQYQTTTESYGPIVRYMCNRRPQILFFKNCFEKFSEQDSLAPQFYFIHGLEQDKPQSFVTRLTKTFIREKYETNIAPDEFTFIIQIDGGCLEYQKKQLIYDLGMLLTNNNHMHKLQSFKSIVEHFTLHANNAIIISHQVSARLFHNELILYYIQDFWTQGYLNYIQTHDKQPIPQFFLFFNIIYEPFLFFNFSLKKKKIMTYLNGFDVIKESDSVDLLTKRRVLIPELSPVSKSDVIMWFNSNKTKLDNKEKEVNKLFKKRSYKSMARVEEFLEGYCQF